MANKKNRQRAALELLNIDLESACYNGKRIVFEGALNDKLLLADFIKHARICAQCGAIIDAAMPKTGAMELMTLLGGLIK